MPHSIDPQLAEGADAYSAFLQSAACTEAAPASFLCMATACHSAIWDTNFFFQDTFTALGNALLLQGEVLLSLDREPWLQMTSKRDSPATLQPLLSILCGTRQKARQFKVRFQNNLDALHFDGSKSVEPLNVSIADLDDTDLHSLMARAPSSQNALARSDTESDAEIHTPTSPSSLHDPHDQRQWRSIQIYDLRANHARGRIQVLPAAAAFIEARRLLGYTHHEVAEIFTISPPPIDLARLHVQPLLLIGHGDLRFGDNRIAVLIDVELHGPDFDSVIETDRYTTLLPDTVTRDFLLRIVGVNSYCHLQSDKCLAWLRGQLLPQQSNRAYQLQHGDYVRIAVPPFDQPPVSTHFAVRACQAGSSRDELIQHYELHGPDADSFHTAITNEQDDPRDEEDAQGLWQTNLCHRFREIPAFLQGPTVGALKLDSDTPHLPSFVVNVEESDHQQVQRGLEDIPRPFLDMHSALLNKAAIACDEEGPVAFIDTWFLSGARPYVTEHSRTLRVDQYLEDWERRLRHLWHDTIDPTSPITFHWVWPVPRELPLRQRLGHLLITQNVANHIVPVHLTIHFAGTRRDAIGFAAALLSTPVEFKATRDLLQLARVCLHRLCQLRWSDRIWQANDRIQVPEGTGLDFFLGTPGARIGDEHRGEPAALAVDMIPNALEELPAPVHPPLEEFSPFIQNLYDAWLNLAVDGPGGLEAVLRVETWFLESGYIRHNDEHRDVVLGEDFWNWEHTFQRRWLDMINPAVDVDYVLVTPTPVTASSPTEIHLILSQLVREFECPSIVTTYDNGVLQGRPYTAAILLPAAVRCGDIISHTGKTLFCPPHTPTTVCTCWHDGQELHPVERFPNRNGFAFILTVHRQFPRQQPRFWQDEEADTLPDPTAASSFLQLHARVTSNAPHKSADDSSNSLWERPTAELVAHTQRPQETKSQPVTLTLDTLIEPPTFIAIDFQQVIDVRTQILQWPLGVVQPAASVVKWHETTQQAFSTTPSWQQETPSGISFYTDGSAAQLQGHWHSAAAVILIVHTRHGDRFGGFRCFETSQVGSAPHAEAAALLTAVLWASQLCDQYENSIHWNVSFNYDCFSAGKTAQGLWQAYVHQELHYTTRSIVQWFEHRFNIHIVWQHVPAHQGHPWNEAADAVAWAALSFWLPVEDFQPLQLRFCQDPACQWLWMLETSEKGQPDVPITVNGKMRLNASAALPSTTQPIHHPFQTRQESEQADTILISLVLKCATANVLTLYQNKSAHGKGLTARHEVLLRSVEEEGLHLIGVQETRSQMQGHCAHLGYHILSAPATSKGVGGVQLWVRQYWCTSSGSITLTHEHLRIVAWTSQTLVVRLWRDELKMIIVVAHAPNCPTFDQATGFWDELTASIPTALRSWPLIALVDANARVGSFVSAAVGSFGAEDENVAGECFHRWLHEQELFLPQTFEQYHQGEHTTWQHSTGATARLDYVALASNFHHSQLSSKLANVDLSLHNTDHFCVRVDIPLKCRVTPSRSYRKQRHDQPQCDLPPPSVSWNCDVHTHAAILQKWLHQTSAPKTRPTRRKTHLQDTTWHMIRWKRFHWNRLRALLKTERLGLLGEVFRFWRSQHPCPIDQSKRPWLRLLDRTLAFHMSQFSQTAEPHFPSSQD